MKSLIWTLLLIVLTGLTVSSQSANPPATTDEHKRIAEENRKIEEQNAAISASFKAGNEAYAQKNYDLAIIEFSKGINAYPQHPGVSALLTNRSWAHISRGNDRFNAALSMTDAAGKVAMVESAKMDWRTSAADSGRALTLERAAPTKSNNFLGALNARANALRMVTTKIDKTQLAAAIAAYKEYQSNQTNKAALLSAQRQLALMIFQTGDPLAAAVEFESILLSLPGDLDATFYAGAVYATAEDKTLQQKGATYLKNFLDRASQNDDHRRDAVDMLEYLKTVRVVPK